MNNERYNQIMMEAYRQYSERSARKLFKSNTYQEFINKCKTDAKFSEKWGLKIEERELSLEERHQLALPIWKEKYGLLADMMVPTNVDNTPYKIPRKLITLTYNGETIESYE